MTGRRTPARRLAIYRAWLLPLVFFTVVLITVIPVAILDRGMHDPGVVLPGVGVLLAWWASFIGTWMNYERLPRDS